MTEAEMMADLQAADSAGDVELAQAIASRIKAARLPQQPEEPKGLGAARFLGPLPYIADKVMRTPSLLASGGRGALQGASLGWADEGAAAVDAALPGFLRNETSREAVGTGETWRDRYENARGFYRGRNEAAKEQHPDAYLAGEIAGAVAPALVTRGKSLAAPGTRLATRAGQGMLRAAPAGTVYGAGASEADTVGGVAKDAAIGGTAAATLGGLLPVAGEVARRVAAPVGRLFGSGAETAAVRATNADRTATRRAFKGSDEARHDLGRAMLDEPGMKLRSPQAIRDSAAAIRTETGKEIGGLVQAADATGATVDLDGAFKAALASKNVAGLGKNAITRSALRSHGPHGSPGIENVMDDWIKQHGGKVTPSIAHDIRMQIDSLANWDQAAPKAVIKAWRAVRSAVDDALDVAMNQAGAGAEWTAANARFASSSKLTNAQRRGLADIGTERRQGNRLGSPSEKASAIAGGLAATLSNPAAAVAIPAATVAANRFFFPVSARAANLASRELGRFASSAARPATTQAAAVSLDPQVAALLEALRPRRLPVALPIGAAEDR